MVQELDTLLDEPFTPREGQRYAPFTYYPAPCKVPKSFKRELAKIGGRTPDGRPVLVCRWGMDIRWNRAVRETSGESVMRRVPRYVMSRDIVTREEQTPAGIWYVKETSRFFGDPHFYIEQWKPAEHFTPPGMNVSEAEEYWETSIRYRSEETDWEQAPSPFKQSGEMKDPATYRAEMKEYTEAMQRHRVLLGADGKGNVVSGREDVMGPFPRSGRYEYLTKLRPAGAQPNAAWLELVAECYWRRKHRKFSDVDDELDDLNKEMAARKSAYNANRIGELEDNLYSHWRSEAEKGEAARVFVKGYEPDQPKGATV